MIKKLLMLVLFAVCLPVVAADMSAPGLVPIEISAGVQAVGDVNKQSAANETGFTDHSGGGAVALGTLSGGGDGGVVLGVCDNCHNQAVRPNRRSQSPGGAGAMSNRVGVVEYPAAAPFEVG